MALGTAADFKNQLLMQPGPTEFDERIYPVLGQKTMSHFDPRFAKQFGNTIKLVRKVLYGNDDTQPYIISGGGSIGWDCIATSLCYTQDNDRALVLNTGYFGENFKYCLQKYGIKCDEIISDIGDTTCTKELINALNKTKYKIVCLTHVDTSTGVCNDVKTLSKIIKSIQPNTLIAVDGVCSFAAESFYFSDWEIDAAMTGSQKAFGVPPGLAIVLLSKNAVNIMTKNNEKIKSWYSNLYFWLPIMKAYEINQCKYFSTPNVNLVQALEFGLQLIVDEGVTNVFKRQYRYSNAFKQAIKKLGLKLVPVSPKLYANTVTAIYFPKNIDTAKFKKHCIEKGCLFAGVLHRSLAGYFRVGHMGVSTKNSRNDLLKSITTIEYALKKCEYNNFKDGDGINTFKAVLKDDTIYSKL